jgi:hypothetical protein
MKTKQRKRTKRNPFDEYLKTEMEGEDRLPLLPTPESTAEAVNFAMKRHVCFDDARLKIAEAADAFGISARSIERYLEKGLPAYRKTHPDTGKRIWYLCGQEALFWMIEAGLAGEIETPPFVQAALGRWQYWHGELVKRGLAEGPADPAKYAASMEHAAFMLWYWYEDLGNKGGSHKPCPFWLDEEAAQSREEALDSWEKIDRHLAEMRGEAYPEEDPEPNEDEAAED